MKTMLQRNILPLVAAVGLSLLPALALPSLIQSARADDTSTQQQPTFGQSVDNAAQSAGNAIGNGAKTVGNTIATKSEQAADATKEGAEKAGNKTEQVAEDTGNWIERSAIKTRDKTAAFFNRVGEFFAGP